MRERRVIYAVILIITMLFADPQYLKAASVTNGFSSLNSYSYYANGIQLAPYKKDSYSIQYFLNGGVENPFAKRAYSKDELPLTLTIPQRQGYNFAGWYTDSNFRHKITSIQNCDYGDLNLYAKWTRCIDSAYNVQMYSYTLSSKVHGKDKELKDCSYGFLDNIDIPGMPLTRERDYMDNLMESDGQCPQGICITDDYYMITAYCSDNDESLGSLYVFDKSTGEYLVTLAMKKRSHLGGLTFDGTNVWICHSDSWSLERISYAYIKKVASMKPKAFVDATGRFKEYRVTNSPSCVTAYDGKLWVATHNVYFKSVMIAYEYRDDELKKVDRYTIPEKVQGVAFDPSGKVYLSTSYGRDKSSYLRIYENIATMDDAPGNPMVKVEMPPCSEDITISQGEVYVLFESASQKYFEGTDGNGRSIAPIDKILTIKTQSVFS